MMTDLMLNKHNKYKHMKNIAIIIVVFFGSLSLSGQDLNTFIEASDSFFKKHVSNGKVAYSEIKKDPTELNQVLKLAEALSVSKTNASNYQAFWINAYNLSVIKGLVNHYPTKSPLDHDGFFDKTKYNLGGKKITLNDIEHKLLRAQFNDARIHFVLVCGAIGCPPLINKAYKPSILESQLQKQAELALNGNYFIKVNTKKKKVEGSELLKWYKDDFTMNGMTEIEYINKYRTEKIPKNLSLIHI